jgi:hypothetical protein
MKRQAMSLQVSTENQYGWETRKGVDYGQQSN